MISINDCTTTPVSGVTAITTIVAAPGAGYKIVVIAYLLTHDTDGEHTWSSEGNAISGAMEVSADTPIGAACSLGTLECVENERLRLTATTAVNGWVRWYRAVV